MFGLRSNKNLNRSKLSKPYQLISAGEEELNNNIDDAVAHYPSMMWGQQPVIYPMMMMMPMSPLGQNGESSDQQRMMQFNPPDVVDGRNTSFSNTNNEVISRCPGVRFYQV